MYRAQRQIVVFVVLLVTGVPALATTPSEFYAAQLGRGAAEVQAGRMTEALTPLRLAAFGFVDSIERYETAQIYLAIALDRLDQTELAREAARRVVTADRIERRYASLALPTSIRSAFEAVARKVLGPSEIAALNQPESVSPNPKPQSSRMPATTTGRSSNRGAGERAPKQAAGSRPPANAIESPDGERASTQTSSQPASTVSNPPPKTPARTSTTASSPPPPQTSSQPATPPTPAPAPRPATTDKPRLSSAKPTEVAQKPAPASPTEPAGVQTSLATADQAIGASDLPRARTLYRGILGHKVLARRSIIRIGEGLYRARDFAGALAAFQRLGKLQPGEEPYHYYIAVALYESGKLAEARQELKAALPHIELTDDVQHYRSKIDGSR